MSPLAAPLAAPLSAPCGSVCEVDAHVDLSRLVAGVVANRLFRSEITMCDCKT